MQILEADRDKPNLMLGVNSRVNSRVAESDGVRSQWILGMLAWDFAALSRSP